MESRQIWITAGIAAISFGLGLIAAPAFKGSESAGKSTETSPASRVRRASKISSPDETQPSPQHRRKAKEGHRSESTISIPKSVLEGMLRKKFWSSSFAYAPHNVRDALPFLGATAEQADAIVSLFDQAKKDIEATEKSRLEVSEADGTRIVLDNRAMKEFSDKIIKKIEDGIRLTLPDDNGRLLISAIQWDNFYPTDEKSYPSFEITRKSSGSLWIYVTEPQGITGYPVDGKFIDDGTPIPADEAFPDDRWKPFLKGLTLLPQNEK